VSFLKDSVYFAACFFFSANAPTYGQRVLITAIHIPASPLGASGMVNIPASCSMLRAPGSPVPGAGHTPAAWAGCADNRTAESTSTTSKVKFTIESSFFFMVDFLITSGFLLQGPLIPIYYTKFLLIVNIEKIFTKL